MGHRAVHPPSKADRPTQAAADPPAAREEPKNQNNEDRHNEFSKVSSQLLRRRG
jgi:hypothetical protein